MRSQPGSPEGRATPASPSSAEPGGVDPLAYRRAIGRLAAGVVVATTFSGRHDHAMTASAVSSVSLDPVLVLICVSEEARWHDAVLDSGVWGLSVLGASSRAASQWLSTPGRPLHGQLDRIPHHRGTLGVALLDDALATMECRTYATHPAGDHSIVVGEVVSVATPARAEAALVHFRGTFTSLQ
jgi:flavin reductase (DIM6/NTAB) family NADH-FMN oxidoreductase RutF